MGYISREKLEKACKTFFYKLIEQGKGFVDVNEFNAELHKIINALPQEAAIEWIDAEWELPVVSDEYIVMIAGAKEATVLSYDAEDQVFFEERIDLDEDVTYKVTHWAEMPGGPASEK